MDQAEIVPLVWPEPPQTARIKFIGNLAGERDLEIADSWREDLLNFLAGGPPPKAQLVNPVDLAVSADAQRVYVSDFPQGRIFVFDLSEKKVRFWDRDQTRLSGPYGIALDAQENVYVVDTYDNVVRVFTRDGAPLRTISPPDVRRITGIAIDRERERIYVAHPSHQEFPDHHVKILDLQGTFLGTLGQGKGFDEGYLLFPTYLAVDPEGSVYVADTMNARVQVFDPESGEVVRTYGERGNRVGQFERPKGLALDTFGNLYVADSGWANVQIFNKEGRVLLFFGGRGRYPGLMNNPTGIAIDKDNRIYVADTQNFRLNIYQLVNTTAEDSRVDVEKSVSFAG